MAAKLTARRVGVTLLELILALGLSVILLFAVSMALRLYWRSFDTKRTNVEQAHLARALLRKIEDDLRSAIQFTPVDLSGLESMTSASSLAGAVAGMTSSGSSGATAGGSSTGGAGSTTGNATGSSPSAGASGGSTATQSSGGQGSSGAAATSGGSKTGSTTTGGSAASPSTGGAATSGGVGTSGQAASGESTATETTEDIPPAVIGLYGSAYQLQFDVSRLPRVDEYGSGNPASMVQIPSDIKTLTYYVRGETSQGSGTISTFGSGSSSSTPPTGSSEPSTSGQGRGLMRLEMDRAVSAYSESNGSASSGYDGAKLLADEVTSIAFRYWDGTAWVSDWNSDEMGGLPLAVEIVMTMADSNAESASGPPVQNFGASAMSSTEPTYRMVVSLPTASLPPPVEEPAEGDAAATGTTTATGSTGTSGSPSGSGATGASGSTSSKSSGGSSGASSGSSSTYGTGSKTGSK